MDRPFGFNTAELYGKKFHKQWISPFIFVCIPLGNGALTIKRTHL